MLVQLTCSALWLRLASVARTQRHFTSFCCSQGCSFLWCRIVLGIATSWNDYVISLTSINLCPRICLYDVKKIIKILSARSFSLIVYLYRIFHHSIFCLFQALIMYCTCQYLAGLRIHYKLTRIKMSVGIKMSEKVIESIQIGLLPREYGN